MGEQLERAHQFIKHLMEQEKSFSKATNLEPQLIEAWMEWGFLEQEAKRYSFSKQYFEQALNLDSINPRANHGYARTLAMLSSINKDMVMEVKYFERGYHSDNIESHHKHSNAINAHAQAIHVLRGLKDYGSIISCMRKRPYI